MNAVVFPLIVFLSFQLRAQVVEFDYCDQITPAINYLEDEGLRLKIDSKLRNGWSYSSFAAEYIAFKLDIKPDESYEDGYLEKSKYYWTQIENNDSFNDVRNIVCDHKAFNNRNPNTIFSKLDEETLLVHITTKRTGKEGSSGLMYLFFFEKNSIVNVLKTSWIS
tara:strand:+ start:27 stop:521 length:495 start_codon:yes stop_codon:yes gene_type:complete